MRCFGIKKKNRTKIEGCVREESSSESESDSNKTTAALSVAIVPPTLRLSQHTPLQQPAITDDKHLTVISRKDSNCSDSVRRWIGDVSNITYNMSLQKSKANDTTNNSNTTNNLRGRSISFCSSSGPTDSNREGY